MSTTPPIPDVLEFTRHIIEIAEGHQAHDHTADEGTSKHVVGPGPLAIDTRGWLSGDNVVKIPSARLQRLIAAQPAEHMLYTHIRGLTWHWTDTLPGTGALLATNIANLPDKSGRWSSWHIVIDGPKIYQSVPFTMGSWHAGGPSSTRFRYAPDANGWAEVRPGAPGYPSLPSANSLFGGIELCNVGEVRFVAGRGWLGWPFGVNESKNGRSAKVPDSDVIEVEWWDGKKRHAQRYAPEQIAAATEVVRILKTFYDIPAEQMAYGHHDLDPDRREDPGPHWMHEILPSILADVYEEG